MYPATLAKFLCMVDDFLVKSTKAHLSKDAREVREMVARARDAAAVLNQKEADRKDKQNKRLLREGGGGHLIGKFYSPSLAPAYADASLCMCVYCNHSNLNFSRNPAVISAENDEKARVYDEAMANYKKG
jgi:hypothetical protein